MKLPPELEDIILSYLYDDVETLSTCSLVHRSWVISAQSRIFHRITLLLVHVERFARLLRTSPHIAQYTKVLGVQDGPRWGTEPEFAEIVSLVLPALKNVHAVALSWVNFIKLSNSAWMSFITNSPHIRSLCLNGCTFDTTPKFLSFVTAFPQLEVLELHCSGANEETTTTNDNIISHSRSPLLLRRLSLDHVSSVSTIVDGLVLAEATSSLKTFQLCDSSLTVEEAASVGRLLLSAGSALEHLELSLSNTNYTAQALSITSNCSLRSVTFDGIIIYNQDSRSNSASWTTVILSQITSFVMERVTFRIWYESVKDIEALHLDRMDDIFRGRQFRGLRQVAFELYGKLLYGGTREDAHQDAIRAIRRRLKFLDNQSLLEFR